MHQTDMASAFSSIESYELFGDGYFPDGTDQHGLIKVIRIRTSKSTESVEISVEGRELSPLKVSFILGTKTFLTRLPKPFADANLVIENGTACLTLNTDELNLAAMEQLVNPLVESLSELSAEVKCTTNKFDESKYDIAVKHIVFYCGKGILKEIKFYKSDDFTLMFSYHTDVEEEIIKTHIEVLNNHPIKDAFIPIKDEQQIAIEDMGTRVIELCAALTFLEDSQLHIRGIPEDVTSARLALNKLLGTMIVCSEPIESFMARMLNKDSIKPVVDAKTKTINKNLHWCVKVQTLYVYGTGRDKRHVDKALLDIKGCFHVVTVNIPTRTRRLDSWTRFLSYVSLQFGGDIDIDGSDEDTVKIGVTDTKFSVIARLVQENKSKWTLITRRVPLTADICNFVMKNIRQDLKEKMMFLNIQQTSDGRTVELSGTEEDVEKVQEIINKVHNTSMGVPSAEATVFLDERQENSATISTLKGTKQILLEIGNIEDKPADVIVNPTSYSLDLTQANYAITTAVYGKAGRIAQRSIQGKEGQMARDHFITGEPGNLPCKRLFHVALDRFDERKRKMHIQVLADTLRRCLHEAAKSGYKSFALPAICTGILQYPCKLVAETMLETMVGFLNTSENRSVETITIVLRKDDKTEENKLKYGVFADEINRRKKEAEDSRVCLVQKSTWVFDSICNITVSSRDDVNPLVERLNKSYSERTC